MYDHTFRNIHGKAITAEMGKISKHDISDNAMFFGNPITYFSHLWMLTNILVPK